MPDSAATEAQAEEVARTLYQALAAAGHAAYCPARLGPLYDEEAGKWAATEYARKCTCGRDAALAAYEAWHLRR